MKSFQTLNIDDKIINKYLFYKNLDINRKFSSNKKKIKKLDHYLWWFGPQKVRKSFLITKDKKPIFISTSDYYKFKKYYFIYSGLISCLPVTNLFDLLKGIKIQNEYLNKQKNMFCFISIDLNNKVLMFHWKYFNYKPLSVNHQFYKVIKKKFNIKNNYKIYYKKI